VKQIARGFVITGDQQYLTPYDTAISQVPGAIASLRRLVDNNQNQLRRLDRVEDVAHRKLAFIQRVIEARRAQGIEGVMQIYKAEPDLGAMLGARDLLAEMEAEEQTVLSQRESQNAAAARRTLVFVGVATLAGVVVLIIAGALIARAITVPIKQLKLGTDRIASGSLDYRIPVVRRDEIGRLAEAFNRMAERRQQTEEQLSRQAKERARVIDAVSTTAGRLASASSEILVGTTQQVSGAQEAAAAVAETVAAIDEIATIASGAADRAKEVAGSARQSDEVGRVGSKAVSSAVSLVGTAKEQGEAVAESILALAEQTQAIGDIITTVNDIAEQTNLLALNAAIEASRAGEHGRGFSVVASEVKALAAQSKKATVQIRQILGDIQRTANRAVLSTEEASRGMSAASRAAREAGETIDALSRTLAKVAESVVQIATSSDQQASAVSQVQTAIKNISKVTTQSLAATKESEHAAQVIAHLGRELSGMLGAEQ